MFAVVLRSLSIYFIVLVLVRLMGKREIGQLSTFDFVVSIIIAELAAMPMEKIDKPLFIAMLPIFTVAGVEILVSYLALKSNTLRALLEGEPVIIVKKGKLMIENMRRTRYNLDDLFIQLREKGYNDITEVEWAILENSGKLSVVPKADYRGVTPSDLNLQVPYEGVAMPIILDGKVIHNNLKELDKNEIWLHNVLETQQIGPRTDVFLGISNGDGRLYFQTKKGKIFEFDINQC